MNKEQRKFMRVIKARQKRKSRLLRSNKHKLLPLKKPIEVVTKKPTVLKRIGNKIKSWITS